MLFGLKLNNEVYGPWKKHYIAYDSLKKMLHEGNIDAQWSEEDESRFVEELDKDLEKVYSFETKTYENISERLQKLENKIENVDSNANINPSEVEQELEQILEEAKQLDQFRRVNFTGFTKIVKKHDRLHTQYQVRPLLHVRLQSLPFHSEDYSPLLYRISGLYKFLSENFASSVTQSAKSQIGSVGASHSGGYITLQFWVHPENLMEVKTRILRRLPILVYNGDNREEEMNHDPTVTSLYCDSPDMMLYHSQLERKRHEEDVPSSLRFRWYGPLYRRSEVVLEQHNEEDGRITRIDLKEKQINEFISGNHSVISKQVQKLKSKNTPQRRIDDYESAANELQHFIVENNIQPVLRTIYKRSAFEIPGDDRVRVILDSDIMFVREDTFNKESPIRDPESWHRADLDQPNVDLKGVLRKGESAKFPYSVLEVRLKQKDDHKLGWVEELKNSDLIKEVPRFTKFLQGISTLYGEDDRLETLPFWLNDTSMPEAVKSEGPKHGHGHEESTKQRMQLTDMNADDFSESDDDSDIEDEPEEPSRQDVHNQVGYPTWVHRGPRLENADSEDEEVVLPKGVVKPESWIKNQTAVKVEAKVWLANERTFNKWLHITCLMSALTFTLYNSVAKASSPEIAEFVAYILFALTLFTGLWGYYLYLHRVESIKARENIHFDNPIGPLVVAAGLLIALVVNFVSHYNTRGAPVMFSVVAAIFN